MFIYISLFTSIKYVYIYINQGKLKLKLKINNIWINDINMYIYDMPKNFYFCCFTYILKMFAKIIVSYWKNKKTNLGIKITH